MLLFGALDGASIQTFNIFRLELFTILAQKFEQIHFTICGVSKNAEWMANRVDPDQMHYA